MASARAISTDALVATFALNGGETMTVVDYQSIAVPEYWIVDADARLIERGRPEDTRPEMLADSLVWHPGAASEALSLDLTGLWTEIADDHESERA